MKQMYSCDGSTVTFEIVVEILTKVQTVKTRV